MAQPMGPRPEARLGREAHEQPLYDVGRKGTPERGPPEVDEQVVALGEALSLRQVSASLGVPTPPWPTTWGGPKRPGSAGPCRPTSTTTPSRPCLRLHGLIVRVPRTNTYTTTPDGSGGSREIGIAQ